MQSKSIRNQGVDLTKAIAILGVIIIHTSSTGLNYSLLSFDWLSSVFVRSVVSASVPLFFMCSGALLLDGKKDFSLRQLYTRRLPRILLALLVWATGYKVFHLLYAGTFSAALLIRALKEVVLFNHEFHLYFLHIILIVYIFLPIARVFTKNASCADLRYLLIVWFAFGILYPTVKGFWPFTLLSGIPTQWAINMTYAAIGYAILGHYMTQYPIRRSLLLISGAVGFVIVFAGTVFMSTRAQALYTGFLEGMSVGVAFLAVGIFGLCCRENKLSKTAVIRQLSNGSFCIYLVHVFMIYFLQELGIHTFSPYIVSIPLISLLNLLLSFVVYAVLKQIPLVRMVV